jgi:hypothetical protein
VTEEAAELSAYQKMVWVIGNYDQWSKRFPVFFTMVVISITAHMFIASRALITALFTTGHAHVAALITIGGMSVATFGGLLVCLFTGINQAASNYRYAGEEIRTVNSTLFVVSIVLGEALLFVLDV